LRAIQPDVVHGQATGLYAGAALTSGYPAVITVHGIRFREARLVRGFKPRFWGWLDSLYERWCLRQARHVISINPYVEQELKPWLRAKVYPIENPISDGFFVDKAEPSEPGRVLFAGVVIRRKGVLTLVQSFRQVLQAVPRSELRIAGDTEVEPEYFAAVKDCVARQGLSDRVHFLGQLTEEAMRQEYEKCALVVLPSVQETAPVVVQEAMAVGRPVVATAVCGTPYLVAHGETGLLVPPEDASALATAMIQILRDPVLAAKMSTQARAEAERRFRAVEVAKQTVTVYEHLMENPEVMLDACKPERS